MTKRTPLYDIHKSLGARMVEFGGWDMPVQYSGIRHEHQAVRTKVGLFDVSHMGEIILEGPGAKEAIQRLSCNDLNRLKQGQCQYSALLTPQGTFVDDIIVYPFSDENILICVNASNVDKDFEWIVSHADNDVTVRNDSSEWCQMALQGPCAALIMESVAGSKATQLKRFHYEFINLLGHRILLSRTGYTGEDGFELYGPVAAAEELWQSFMQCGQDHGLVPCGLGARDTLRLEANYPLYGHEIDDSINPFEAGLDWIVKLEKEDFIGKTALEAIKHKGIERKLIGIRMEERGIPRQGNIIYAGGEIAGKIASGSLSPSLDVGIGTAFVPVSAAKIGSKIAVDIHGKKRKAAIVGLPFYKKER